MRWGKYWAESTGPQRFFDCFSLPAMAFILMVTLSACQDTSVSTVAEAANPTATNTTAPSPTPSPVPSTATPLPTNTPQPTNTPTPLPTSTSTVTATPSPSPTPGPIVRQLTQNGCCVQPFFSPDGTQVLFIDKPSEDAPVGIYGVNLGDSLPATPVLVEEVIGFRSADRTIVATLEDDLARFTNEDTGQSWSINTGGNWPRFAPDNSRILWVAADKEGPYDQRQSDIWLSNLDGSNAGLILSLYGGGYQDWLPDGNRLLLVGRDVPYAEDRDLLIYNLSDNQKMTLATHKRIRGIELSPGGSWVAYFVDFADEPEDRGLWVVSTDGETRKKLLVPGFGGYRWQNDNTLLLIPMRTSRNERMQVWAIDVESNQFAPLTSPDAPSFSILNGDWEVSPDGNNIAFVNSADNNIWLMTLP